MQDLLLMQRLQRPNNLSEPFQELRLVWYLRATQVLQVGKDVPMLAVLHQYAKVPGTIDKGIAISHDVWMLHGP